MKKIFFLAVLALGMESCYYDNEEELYPSDPNSCNTDSLTYDNQIGSLINTNCSVSGCHAAGGESPTLTTYQEVKSNIDRIEIRALIEKTMPPTGPLPQCELSQLTQWIADGAPEN